MCRARRDLSVYRRNDAMARSRCEKKSLSGRHFESRIRSPIGAIGRHNCEIRGLFAILRYDHLPRIRPASRFPRYAKITGLESHPRRTFDNIVNRESSVIAMQCVASPSVGANRAMKLPCSFHIMQCEAIIAHSICDPCKLRTWCFKLKYDKVDWRI